METRRTPYELIGGDAGVRALTEAFYAAMDRLPEAAGVRALHAADLAPMKLKLYEFLSGWFGGPRLYFEKYGGVCMHGPHSPYAIGPAERDQWLLCMAAALNQINAAEELRAMLRVPLYRFADALRNVEPAEAAAGT